MSNDWAERLHAAYGMSIGKAPAPWCLCRKATRQHWRREARHLLAGLIAAHVWRNHVPNTER